MEKSKSKPKPSLLDDNSKSKPKPSLLDDNSKSKPKPSLLDDNSKLKAKPSLLDDNQKNYIFDDCDKDQDDTSSQIAVFGSTDDKYIKSVDVYLAELNKLNKTYDLKKCAFCKKNVF